MYWQTTQKNYTKCEAVTVWFTHKRTMQNWCSESVPKCFCHHLLQVFYTRPTDAIPMDVLAVLELHPTPREMTLAPLRGEKKSLSGFSNLVPVWPCTFWQLAEVIHVDLPYSCIIKIGKSLWREPMNCTYWAASDCWVVPLVLTVHTMFWLVSISWSKKRCKAKRSKCNREKVLPLAMRSHSKQIVWDQKGHIVE